MQYFTFNITGDIINNVSEWNKWVDTVDQHKPIRLDFNFEPVCAYSSGIFNSLVQKGIDVNKIKTVDYPNSHPDVPFRVSQYTHEWRECAFYTPSLVNNWNQKNVFGLFIGRPTTARVICMYFLAKNQNTMISHLQNAGIATWNVTDPVKDLELSYQWHDYFDLQKIDLWYSNQQIPSLDNLSIEDQYHKSTTGWRAEKSIQRWYNDFLVEIVMETTTVGKVFNPTEKTLRPFVCGKPALIYAAKDHIEMLNCCGLKTYGNFWDESYDTLAGPERLLAILEQMKYIESMSKRQLLQLYHASIQIAHHNRKRIEQIRKSRRDPCIP